MGRPVCLPLRPGSGAAPLAVLALAALAAGPACSGGEEGPPTPPGGEACRYVGTVTGNDGPDAPAGPEACHYVATLNPLSGPLGAVGLPLQNAARLAVRDVNRAGPVAGKRLCLIACDTRTDPSAVGPMLETLAERWPLALVNGAAASASTIQAAAVTRRRDIPQISCCSTSPVLSSTTAADPEANFGHVFRTVPSDALQGVVLAQVARRLSPVAERVAVIYVDDAYGQSLRAVFTQAFVGAGGQVVAAVPYRPGEPAYDRVIEAAFAEPVDHVVLIAFPTDGAQVLRDWRTSGLGRDVRWLATDGLRDDKFVLGAGIGATVEVIGTAPRLEGARFAGFESRYRQEYGGEAPGIFTSNQYDAVLLFALAAARPGASGGAALRAAIRDVSGGTRSPGTSPLVVSADELAMALSLAAQGASIDYDGASGAVDVDGAGDVVADYSVWRVASAVIEDTDDCWRCRLALGRPDCNLGCAEPR